MGINVAVEAGSDLLLRTASFSENYTIFKENVLKWEITWWLSMCNITSHTKPRIFSLNYFKIKTKVGKYEKCIHDTSFCATTSYKTAVHKQKTQ
jgi:hypothetical protein